jgi:hypothetical protein
VATEHRCSQFIEFRCVKDAGSQFCEEHQLHSKTMFQMLKLRHQLTNVAVQAGLTTCPIDKSDDAHEYGTIKPPNRKQKLLLRQIVLSGQLENVARRIPKDRIQEGSRLQRVCAYEPCNPHMQMNHLYIHPTSGLFSTNPDILPEYVCYSNVERGSQGARLAYMRNVTAVEVEWMSKIAAGTPMYAALRRSVVVIPVAHKVCLLQVCHIGAFTAAATVL